MWEPQTRIQTVGLKREFGGIKWDFAGTVVGSPHIREPESGMQVGARREFGDLSGILVGLRLRGKSAYPEPES